MVGRKAIWGLDIVRVVAVMSDDYVKVELLHPSDQGKTEVVAVEFLEFL